MKASNKLLIAVLAVGLSVTYECAAGVASSAIKSTVMRKVLREDMANHAGAPVVVLRKSHVANRYTTKAQAQKEVKEGIKPETHMTTGDEPGRQLSARRAQRIYGLGTTPEVVETIRIPKRQPVRITNVAGGGKDALEITSPRHIPRGAIIKVEPLEDLKPGR